MRSQKHVNGEGEGSDIDVTPKSDFLLLKQLWHFVTTPAFFMTGFSYRDAEEILPIGEHTHLSCVTSRFWIRVRWDGVRDEEAFSIISQTSNTLGMGSSKHVIRCETGINVLENDSLEQVN